MQTEQTTPPDDLYELIVAMHEDLSLEESERANAKLILILADHIGDTSVLRNATKIARENTLNLRTIQSVGKDTSHDRQFETLPPRGL